ncbi:MAG: hypothetical protein ACK40I_00955 [Tabrizicola sp.]
MLFEHQAIGVGVAEREIEIGAPGRCGFGSGIAGGCGIGGLQLIGEDGAENDTTFTIYGNTKLASGVGLGAFLSGVDSDVAYANDYAIGIGASYDLGGASVAGTIQQGFHDETYADLGINFSF